MDLRNTLVCCSIEGVGGLLVLVSLAHMTLCSGPVLTEVPHVALPLILGGGIFLFGRWLDRHDSFDFNVRQRGLVTVGHLIGGATLGLVTGWILVVVGVEYGFPNEIDHILLNGAAIGMVGGGVLTAVYLRLRQQQTALRTRTTQLQKQNARLEKLASIVSHDLRNPLNVAQGRLELAEETGDPEQFEAVERSLDRMELIIEDMLVLSTQPHDSIESAPASLETMARSAWQTVETDNVTLDIEDSATLVGDERQLRHVFENVFRNSVEHGGDTMTTIRVGVLDTQRFYIEDNGVGIPESERDTVTEWGTTVESDGTGLGLAIVDEIIDAHDWSMRITEGSARGARFEITGVEFSRA